MMILLPILNYINSNNLWIELERIRLKDSYKDAPDYQTVI
jgi:hypothetical protein